MVGMLNIFFRQSGLALTSVMLLLASTSAIQRLAVAEEPKAIPVPPPRFDALAIFKKDFVGKGFFEGTTVDVTEHAPAKAPQAPTPAAKRDVAKDGPVFVSNDPTAHILPPDEDPKVRINPDAPGPFIAMTDAYQHGDRELAGKYADQWVRYQSNFFFEVRELTQIIGESLIRQGVIKDDDWDGVGQMIDYEFAKTRRETGSIMKPTHDKAMDRIVSDKKNEVEIYYFFTLNCSFCRHMAPDVERLWRSVKQDPKVKMVALTLGPTPKEWVSEYRKYTGLTLPVLEGEKTAKAFNVRFVPGLVLVAPNNKQAYLKTGEQDFARLYQFVRKVQGLPMTPTPELEKIVATPIGQTELANAAAHPVRQAATQLAAKGSKPVARPVSLEKF